MPNSPETYSHIQFRHGTLKDYNNLESIDNNTIYFITDTNQIFVGKEDYTHTAEVLSSIPTDSDEGSPNTLYFCSEDNGIYTYVNNSWICASGVLNLTSGEGIVTDPENITYSGTISHAIPQGAKELSSDTSEISLKLGESFTTNEITTDKFGHVVGISERIITLPAESELSHLFEYKGAVQTVDDLPDYSESSDEANIGDVYYVIDNTSEYVYIESGWEELGPYIDLSYLIEKVEGYENNIVMFNEDGSLTSSGYTNLSGVASGTYGSVSDNSINIPVIEVDEYGRITEASDNTINIIDKNYAADSIAFILETYI